MHLITNLNSLIVVKCLLHLLLTRTALSDQVCTYIMTVDKRNSINAIPKFVICTSKSDG